jgi:hypothetical protein
MRCCIFLGFISRLDIANHGDVKDGGSAPNESHNYVPLVPVCAPGQAAMLVNTDWFTHGGLDKDGANVLPVLLEERDEKVDGEHGVGE